MSPLQKQIAAVCDLLQSAYDDGHADAMDLCAVTDEQRLNFISKLVALLDEVQCYCPVEVQDRIRELIKPKPRPIDLVTPEQIQHMAEKSKQMREEYEKRQQEDAE